MREPEWRAVQDEQTDLAIEKVISLGEGWTSRVYLVNDDVVFKFPKDQRSSVELQHEIEFLDYARERLPSPVPRYFITVRRSDAAPHGYAAYRHLRGEPLTRAHVSPQGGPLLGELATFLGGLHALRPPPDVAARLPDEDPKQEALDMLEATRRVVIPQVPAAAAAALERAFHVYLGDVPAHEFRPALIHADLHDRHVLVRDGHLAGVLDFGDVGFGDPDYDFGFLGGQIGQAATRALAACYEHPDPERLMRKVRLFTLLDAVDAVVDGPGRAPQNEIDRAWERLRTLR